MPWHQIEACHQHLFVTHTWLAMCSQPVQPLACRGMLASVPAVPEMLIWGLCPTTKPPATLDHSRAWTNLPSSVHVVLGAWLVLAATYSAPPHKCRAVTAPALLTTVERHTPVWSRL